MTAHAPLISTQDDLFHEEVSLLLPERFAINCKVLGNPVRQLESPEKRELCRLRPFSVRQIAGYEATLQSGEILRIISAKTATQLNADLVLLVAGASDPAEISLALERGEGRWVGNTTIDLSTLDAAARKSRLEAITASWDDAFQLRESRPAKGDRPATPGLRRPQIGALHASLAHLTRSGSPATIVMPTGTGKTETMLALNAHQRFERLLVVVPNDALREQIAGKFETFGVLRYQEC
ncbi:TPA: DEAD/DEAH box helicase family protein, partial [Pseudomonas aeruginosa]|nr:DEAD/DEAH box helicase family protein [Pseudomonas aeruginosa]HBO4016420.1 DEAD/DEAH box helicase family protein [Pseudomonas aeruginosa]HCH0590744.1 DEAD/DEAH box helicase family protein [Pseudomonas aeruginosa]